MSRHKENFLDILSECPWWVSIAVGAVVFVGLRFIAPAMAIKNPLFATVGAWAPAFAPFAAVFLFPAAVSAIRAFRKRRMLERQSGIESIRALSWKEFEELLAEAYRRSGYAVTENISLGPDGGVDLAVEKGGDRYLVQAKQWKSVKVPVSVVREMFGLMTAEGASGVIIVTSGMFTQEAKNFASDKPIDLVEGNQLVEMIRGVQTNPPAARVPGARPTPPAPGERPTRDAPKVCPLCGGPLRLYKARRGKHAGSSFWGSASFPTCKYIKPDE